MRIATTALAAGLCLCLLAGAVLAQKKGGRPKGPRRGGPRAQDKLKAGDVAPNFTLATLDGKKKVTLSEFRGKRPVALIFGSYT